MARRLLLTRQRHCYTCLYRQARGFHSLDHPIIQPSTDSSAEGTIVAAAYAQVPRHGFSQHALAAGARDAGYLDTSPSVLTDGPFKLIRYHLTIGRQELSTYGRDVLQGVHGGDMLSPGRKVEMLLWRRLLVNRHIIHHWQQALAIMAQPRHAAEAIDELANLSDDILCLARDDSVDSSWYAKRARVSLIYSTSELFMSNDTSPGFEETKGFLHRRLNETDGFGDLLLGLRRYVGFTATASINLLRSKGVRV